jgi:SAM-dependent methyltransferase
LHSFSVGYLCCDVCGTLVAAQMPTVQEFPPEGDGHDFYGNRFFERLSKESGDPSLQERARTELTDRFGYWLSGLLKYKQPPARILELGSSYGGFVATMRWAGFDAFGLDLSPGLCYFARQTFNVPILTGPVESQEIPPESLDGIVLMDVLEHLCDPLGTLSHCASLLKPDGIFYLQTPEYHEGKTLEEMELEEDAFLQLLLPDQHLHLFSRSSTAGFFQQLGFKHIEFGPATSSENRTVIVAGRQPIVIHTGMESGIQMEAVVSSYATLALLDLGIRYHNLNIHTQAVSRESEERERGLHELTGIIRERDARIAEVERMAQERLVSLEALNILAEEIRHEAEKRERGLHELTAIIGARDARIAEAERMAEERLASLEALHNLVEKSRTEFELVAEQQRATQSALGESLVREAALRAKIRESQNETILVFIQRRIRERKFKSDATGS